MFKRYLDFTPKFIVLNFYSLQNNYLASSIQLPENFII